MYKFECTTCGGHVFHEAGLAWYSLTLEDNGDGNIDYRNEEIADLYDDWSHGERVMYTCEGCDNEYVEEDFLTDEEVSV